jgi:Putative Ig domain
LGKTFKAIASSVTFSFLFYCLGCASGPATQTANQQTAVAPSITQVSPEKITAGCKTATVRVTGTNFPTQAAILWNGAALATAAIDGNTLSGTIGSSSIANPATVQVQVQNTQTMEASPAVPVVIEAAKSGSSNPNCPLTISLTPLPQGVVSASYTGTLSVTGGSAPYTWSIASGQLPAGLSLAPTGIISGTPAASGSFSFTVSVADSSSSPQAATATMPLTVAAAPAAPTPLTINSSLLPSGTIGSGYSTSLQASGGSAPYAWSILSGNLPAGLSLNTSTGLISGTPTASGTATFTAAVADAGTPAQTKSVTLSLVVAPLSLAITSSSLSSGTQSVSYSRALQAIGGTSPYTWSISSGALPAGLSLAPSTGVVSGTPTTSGNFSFGVSVHDAGSPAQNATATVTLSLLAAGVPLAITSTTLPGGTSNQPYNATVNAIGGKTPYSWSMSGTLPTGLAFANGVISGTPTASGTTSPTFTVTDSSSPAQSKSLPLSIAVAAPPALTINASLPAGTASTAYSSPMSATGGSPAYTWSITSGSLPTGLTLAATTGIVSGTPTTSGTYNFTATVSDNGTPVQTKSAATSIVVAAAAPPPGPGTTWYVRPDGGSRYSAGHTTGQCDGKADTAYGGTGTNQHCAFGDVRWLYDAQDGNSRSWVIAGGDTVIIRGGPWRIGHDQGITSHDAWCNNANDNNQTCYIPQPPAGTAAQHTVIEGENCITGCPDASGIGPDVTKITELYGGFGLYHVLDLNTTSYVDFKGLGLTRHSQCIQHGQPAFPSACSPNGDFPADDFAIDGIATFTGLHDVLFQDMWVHGFTDRGVIGPIGGTVTAERMRISYNGMAGWDFDDGNADPSINNPTWNFLDSIIEFSGCNQEYPYTHPYPVASCYSQSTSGYGDGVGTPPGTPMNINVNHSIARYNTQDGMDIGHIDTGSSTQSVTNSQFYGNNGGQYKWGYNFSSTVFQNNVVNGNCLRMSQPLAGAPSTYNANLTDFCRAYSAMSWNFRDGQTLFFANNTLTGYAPSTFVIGCSTVGGCPHVVETFQNNIILAYDNPATYNIGGQAGGVAAFYCQDNAASGVPQVNCPTWMGTWHRSNNIWYGMNPGHFTCPTGYPGESCANPLLVNQPTFTSEQSLDNFNFDITTGSPAMGAGVYLPTVLLDYTGAARANPPSIGAYDK